MTSVRAANPPEFHAGPIIGKSRLLRRAISLAQRFAAAPLPVLLVGETGTGKELFARNIHAWSGRPGGLVDVDCAALPRDLVEGILFGRRRGAFTGAYDSAPGLVEEAHGGTLFLDELSSLPVTGQSKILRVLETGETRRVGDVRKRASDLRLVAAAQADIDRRLVEGTFRLDLFQRVAGVVIRLPTLRDRPEDLLPLATHFARGRGADLAGGVQALLVEREWPGNVRELRGAVERAAVLAPGAAIDASHLEEAFDIGPGVITGQNGNGRHGAILAAMRSDLMAAAAKHGPNAGRIAESLGVGRATLFRRLKRLGLSLHDLGRST